jgi:hypothetical protein
MSECCSNLLTIKFHSENHLHEFVSNYIENYAGASEKKVICRGIRGIATTCYTRAEPDFEWLEKILRDYPNCWIKNEWEDYVRNIAGVWVGRWNASGRVIDRMEWDDITAEDRTLLFGWRQGQRHN